MCPSRPNHLESLLRVSGGRVVVAGGAVLAAVLEVIMWSTRLSGPALWGAQIRARLIPLVVIVVALAHLAAGGGGEKATPIVSIDDVNPGTSVSRGLCLTIALGGAASECGDLRTVHGLPATRTMNRARAPVLLYNSQHAAPWPLVAANVRLEAGADVPDSVEATLEVPSEEITTTEYWDGDDWTAGSTRRIAIGGSALSDLATGMYAYTLEVAFLYGQQREDTAVAGELVVVDRSESPFGAGWWLAGLESLIFPSDSTILWVGGDGSTRLYEELSDTVWAAEAVARPDTLKWVSSEDKYLRELPGGVKVWFDEDGYHVATENRLGHETEFYYTQARLDSITLPVPTGAAGRKYAFEYGVDTLLTKVTAPPIGEDEREVDFFVSGGRVDSIMDPDGEKVKFGYSGDRIVARTDRRGTVTSYSYDSGKRVEESQVDTEGLQITDSLRPLESLGLATAVDTGLAYTRLNGPRTDVADTTIFWLDRFGSPRRIVNALGDSTLLVHDTQFPALVSEVIHANTFTQRAWYNARGNVDSVMAEEPYGDGRDATTRYEYDDVWRDFVSRVVLPEGDETVIDYDAVTGNPAWQEDARGDTSRVVFHYYDEGGCAGLVSAVDPPKMEPDSVAYDGWCNVSATWTPTGFKTEYERDAIGRETLVVGPIDSERKDSTRIHYDLMDRDTLRIGFGPADTVGYGECSHCDRRTLPAEKLYVATEYDAEGNVTQVTRWVVPDPGTPDLFTTYAYDRAHRKTSESHGMKTETFAYGLPIGSPTSVIISGDTTKMWYDELNRLARRVVPEVSYSAKDCDVYRWLSGADIRCLQDFDAVEVAADTAVFAYDAVGNMTVAANRDARVYRSYYPNSQVKTDTLKLRKYDTSGGGGPPGCPPNCPEFPEFEGMGMSFPLPGEDGYYGLHRYGLRYEYDLNGRRSLLRYPMNLASGDTVVSYEYYGWGALERVTGLRDEEYEFSYDSAGRLDTLSYPGGAGSRYAYDGDGRLALRMTWDSGGAYLQADTLVYDRRGKLLSGQRASGSKVRNVYTGLGQLAASEWWLNASWKLDEWTVDGLSHNSESHIADYATPEVDYLYTYNANGELESRELPVGDTVNATQLYRVYDSAGNMRFGYESDWDWSPPDFEEVYARSHQSAYGADQKLQFYQQFGRQVPNVGESDNADDLRQEFRYDALGRRVLVRNLHRPYCDTQERDCTHAIERYIWDGDQILYELRAPGDTSDALETAYGSGRDYGRVAYVHGGGIDTPLGLVRYDFGTVLLAPHSDWRGQWELATDEDGADYAPGLDIDWPSTAARSYMEVSLRANQGDWVGSLLRDQRDPSGFLYRRNRYYDPMAGRFTQPDPIGLAGGSNLYGFAGGDPVNSMDPFGLCVDERGNQRPCTVEWGSEASDSTVTEEMRRVVQRIADAADVDLVLSSGRRAQGDDCSSSRHNCGKAVDIKAINGVDIGRGQAFNSNALTLVMRVQAAAMDDPAVRENYGPAALLKSFRSGQAQVARTDLMGVPKTGYVDTYNWLWRTHRNHVHISIQ